MNHAYLAGILELFRCSVVGIERIIKNTMTTGIVDEWLDPKEIDKKLLQSLRLVKSLKSVRACVHDAALRVINQKYAITFWSAVTPCKNWNPAESAQDADLKLLKLIGKRSGRVNLKRWRPWAPSLCPPLSKHIFLIAIHWISFVLIRKIESKLFPLPTLCAIISLFVFMQNGTSFTK